MSAFREESHDTVAKHVIKTGRQRRQFSYLKERFPPVRVLRRRHWIGVYSRPAGVGFPGPHLLKEQPMASKRLDRRELLKGGAALAGGLTLGAVTPAVAGSQEAGSAQGAAQEGAR